MDEALVVGDDRNRAGMLDDLALDLAAVGPPEALHGDVEQLRDL